MDPNGIFETLSNIRIGTLYLTSLLSAVLILVICLIVAKIVNKVAGRALDKSKMEGALRSFIKAAIRVALWILTAIIVADSLGIPSASLVAVLSVAGLALSLSLQNTLANLFAGLTILATHPFATGDYVEVGTIAGSVRAVGLFHTQVATVDNKLIYVPNSDVTAAKIINYSHEELRRVDMLFDASYDNGTEQVKAALYEAISGDPRILVDPAPQIALLSFKASSVEYALRVWVAGKDYWNVYFDLNEAVRESFARNNIQMTYDHLNVHLVREPDQA